MYKIKLTFPYPDWPLLRQTPGYGGRWGGYQFFINPDPAVKENFDYWVVFNFLTTKEEVTQCRKGNVILITGEPDTIEQYSNKYVSQFNYIITSQQGLRHDNKFYIPQGLPWFVNRSFDELTSMGSIPKTKSISIISSTKSKARGHRERFNFAKKLKEYFGHEIDLFGRGINDFSDKWDVLAPYKYSIAIENTSQPNYFTEKIMDCYLSFTYPIYFGCLNIADYFDQGSLSVIDINNFNESVKRIESLIEDKSHYQNSLEGIIKAREKVLTYYNLFPLIVNFVEGHVRDSAGISISFTPHKIINFQNAESFFSKIANKIGQK